ncbi:hypothetical protein TELCIR_11404 [Teladorsagia circumcincta]|uniref:Uncharacterized protein n=1 Tax=Teladorsagia circumcincta TaxID=45464 RepID=A0A2G9U9C7_TELCI|nr:hypothetical protein TELCIR_11404 [Teladorsagia circumcincta]
MRGRDHGLPSYVAHRKFCGLSRPLSFEDLTGEMPPSAIDALRSVYELVEDVDLFTGILSEIPMKATMVDVLLNESSSKKGPGPGIPQLDNSF